MNRTFRHGVACVSLVTPIKYGRPVSKIIANAPLSHGAFDDLASALALARSSFLSEEGR